MNQRSARHHAPAVRFPVHRSAWLAGVLACGSVAGGLALAAWTLWGSASWPLWMPLGAWLAWLLATGAVWRFWVRMPVGILAWDGGAWELHGPQGGSVRGTLTIHLDLQRRMAVCLVPLVGVTQWLWLERGSAAAHWLDLRRAVYSRPATGVSDVAEHASGRVDPA
ncbi:MAG: hypothetical protein Q8O81_00390 [Giesbergeria sp.]|nr:hypothetical protein [Giesbergeria sp.]